MSSTVGRMGRMERLGKSKPKVKGERGKGDARIDIRWVNSRTEGKVRDASRVRGNVVGNWVSDGLALVRKETKAG